MNAATPTHRPVVVAPTYNNAATVIEVLQRTRRLGLPIIVVNDGSADDTADRLAAWQSEAHATDDAVQTHVLHHPQNRGKAAAMDTGFRQAIAQGFTHAVTIDTDLQHEPEDIPALLAASHVEPHALVLGERPHDLENTPRRSLAGRWWSNLAIRVECGLQITDSQSGLRIYPLSLIERAHCQAGHYGYETEIIVRAVWLGHPVQSVPISSRYLPAEERVSHFRPWLDTLRCMTVHAHLLPRTPWHRTRRMMR